MSETADPAPQGGAEESGKSSKKRRLLMIGAPILLLSGLGIGAFLYLGADTFLPSREESAAAEPDSGSVRSGEAREQENAARKILIMDDHLVNLSSSAGGPNRYARVRIAVVYNPTGMPIGQIEDLRPYLRDAFHGFLGQLSERDLQGTFGLVTIKEELLRRARAVAGNTGITEILITDLVIQ